MGTSASAAEPLAGARSFVAKPGCASFSPCWLTLLVMSGDLFGLVPRPREGRAPWVAPRWIRQENGSRKLPESENYNGQLKSQISLPGRSFYHGSDEM
jgi:hypothetical protein